MHPTACIEIPAGTVGEFVTEYFSENGRRNRIIGELSINGSVQFIRLSKIWGSILTFIPNPRDPDISSRWGSTGPANSNENTGSNIVARMWGGSFSNSNMSQSGNWSVSINSSPADSLRSLTCPRIYQSRISKDFLQLRRQQRLWRRFNHANPWVHHGRQNRDFSDGP